MTYISLFAPPPFAFENDDTPSMLIPTILEDNAALPSHNEFAIIADTNDYSIEYTPLSTEKPRWLRVDNLAVSFFSIEKRQPNQIASSSESSQQPQTIKLTSHRIACYATRTEFFERILPSTAPIGSFLWNGHTYSVITQDSLSGSQSYDEFRNRIIRDLFSWSHTIVDDASGTVLIPESQWILGQGSFARVIKARIISHNVIPRREEDEQIRDIALKIFTRISEKPIHEGKLSAADEDCTYEKLICDHIRSNDPAPHETPCLANSRITISDSAFRPSSHALTFDLMERDLHAQIELLHKNASSKSTDGKSLLSTAQNYMRQIFSQLAFCHKNGVIHCDLKPNNILIKKDEVKITDFGSALVIDHPELQNDATYIQTRWYRSPEVLFRLMPYTQKIDIWSAALIFLEIIDGRALLTGNDAREQLIFIIAFIGCPDDAFIKKVKRESAYCTDDRKKIKTILTSNNPKSLFIESFLEKHGIEDPDLEDLIKKMFRWEPAQRPTAEEILEHPFFQKKYS